jgi:hypothetical protein
METGGAIDQGAGAPAVKELKVTELRTPVVPQPSAAYLERVEARVPRPIQPRAVPMQPKGFSARFLIWKQDPTVGETGIRTTYIPNLVLNGPKDARIATELAGTTPVARNANTDFIFKPGTAEFDCAHTWAVVRQTLTMLERLRGGTPIPWAWNRNGNTDVLTVHPLAGETANAYYSRGQQALKFFYFTPDGGSKPVHTCRSLDIVAHEAGHAILDGLKPGWLASASTPQTGGLHESFGDLCAVFLALSQLDQVEAVVALSKADLHDKTFIAAVAEQFGSALGRPTGLRNADNDLKLSEVSNEVHAISQVFTGGIYDFLADVYAFQRQRQRRSKDPAHVLLEVARQVCTLVLQAIVAAPDTDATYADVVNQMLKISHAQGDPKIYRHFLRSRFTLREVLSSSLTAMAAGQGDLSDPDFTEGDDALDLEATHISATLEAPQNRVGCCGTMRLPEFTVVGRDVIESGASLSDADLLERETRELAEAFT